MSDKRDAVRYRLIEIIDSCVDVTRDPKRNCSNCPNDSACTFLMAFDDWMHIHSHRKAGDEDLERLIDSVMTIEDYVELLKPDEEV